MSSSRPIDNPKDPRTDEKPVFSKELVQEDLKDEFKAGSNSEWATDSQDELEDWIEEQGIQLRYYYTLLTISNSFKYIKNQSRKICGLSIMISPHFPAHFSSIVSQNDYLFFLSSSNSFLRRSASTDILSARSFSLASFPSNSSIRILYLSNGSSIAPSNNGFISSHPPIS